MAGTASFDLAAEDFDRLAPLLWDPVAAATLARSQPRPGEVVLDACCGTGASAVPTAVAVGPAGRVDAVDLSAPMIEVLRRKSVPVPQLHAVQADVTRWGEAGYDLVQAVMGIFFLPDMAATTRGLAARCRPGGRVAFTVWRRGAVVVAGEALTTAVSRVRQLPPPPAAPRHPLRDIDTVETYGAWLSGLGLREVVVGVATHAVDLTPENAWLVVLGSGFRGMLQGLDPDQVERVRQRYLDELERRAATELDATSLVGLGIWPHGS